MAATDARPENRADRHRPAKGNRRPADGPSRQRRWSSAPPGSPTRSAAAACRWCSSMSTGAAPGRTEQARGLGAFPDDWTELVAELNPQPQDHRVTKRTWGAFTNTGLLDILKREGVTQVVIAGIATSAGVESTARQAHEFGFHVDAGDRRDDRHAARGAREQRRAHFSAPRRDGDDRRDPGASRGARMSREGRVRSRRRRPRMRRRLRMAAQWADAARALRAADRRPRASAPARGAAARVARRRGGADRLRRRGRVPRAAFRRRPGDRRLPDCAGPSALDPEGDGARLADLSRRRSVGGRGQRRAGMAADAPARSSGNDRGLGRFPRRCDRYDADVRGLRRRRPPRRPHAISAGGHGHVVATAVASVWTATTPHAAAPVVWFPPVAWRLACRDGRAGGGRGGGRAGVPHAGRADARRLGAAAP